MSEQSEIRELLTSFQQSVVNLQNFFYYVTRDVIKVNKNHPEYGVYMNLTKILAKCVTRIWYIKHAGPITSGFKVNSKSDISSEDRYPEKWNLEVLTNLTECSVEDAYIYLAESENDLDKAIEKARSLMTINPDKITTIKSKKQMIEKDLNDDEEESEHIGVKNKKVEKQKKIRISQVRNQKINQDSDIYFEPASVALSHSSVFTKNESIALQSNPARQYDKNYEEMLKMEYLKSGNTATSNDFNMSDIKNLLSNSV